MANTFAFTYEDSRELIELFFSTVDDPSFTMDSILQKIEGEDEWDLSEWDKFSVKLEEKMQAGRAGTKEIPVQSWRRFSRLIRKNIKGTAKDLFRPGYTYKKIKSKNLSTSIESMKKKTKFM